MSGLASLQDRIFGHRHHVFHIRLGVQKLQQFRIRETTVQPNSNPRFPKALAQQRQGSPQNPQRSPRRRGLAGSQHRREQVLLGLVVESDKPHHGQIAPSVVIAVEQGQLLGPVGRVVGGIQIDGDASGPAMQPLGMPLDHAFRQGSPQAVEILAASTIFKTRQGGLRSQIQTLARIASQQHLMHRVRR